MKIISKLIIFGFTSLLFCAPANTFAQRVSDYRIEIDKDTAYLWCPINTVYNPCPKNAVKFKVRVVRMKNGLAPGKYKYKVTAGKIIGNGSEVVWDLTKQWIGSYAITVFVTEPNTKLRTAVSKIVDVEECPECNPGCECPGNIGIESNRNTIKPNKKVKFFAKVRGGDQRDITYNWKVKNGVIVSRGKRSIKVKAGPGSERKNLEVVLEIGGLCDACETTASKKIPIVE